MYFHHIRVQALVLGELRNASWWGSQSFHLPHTMEQRRNSGNVHLFSTGAPDDNIRGNYWRFIWRLRWWMKGMSLLICLLHRFLLYTASISTHSSFFRLRSLTTSAHMWTNQLQTLHNQAGLVQYHLWECTCKVSLLDLHPSLLGFCCYCSLIWLFLSQKSNIT